MEDKFLEGALLRARSHSLISEGLKKDYGDGCALIGFDLGICPINIEVYDFEGVDFSEGQKADIRFALFPHGDGDIYKDEAEYYAEAKRKANGGMVWSAESIIPSGTFSPTADENFEENSSIILRAVVTDTESVMLDGERTLHLTLKMEDCTFDSFFEDGMLPFAEKGNVISATFLAIGVSAKK